jgi:endonuclease YncB( thermonuclease family)
MTRTAIAVLAALILAPASATAADNLAGQASVVDGDTLEIHGTRIRLWGIDAPESSQLCRGEDSLQYRCGAKAANDLDAFIAGRPVNSADLAGPIRSHSGGVLGRRRRPRWLARAQRSRFGLAAGFKTKVR